MPALPQLSQARASLTQEIEAVNELGVVRKVFIPAERDLTIYVDKRELVTLMTLGAFPEHLVLGYLLNQRLVDHVQQIQSITVDWEVGAAAVKTHDGIDRIEQRTAKKVVTTGCGQGSVFGSLLDQIDQIQLPGACLSQTQLYGITQIIRLQDSTYKSTGSVHGCALFRGNEKLMFVEDVGRHNAMDTLAGWMAMQGIDSRENACATQPYVFYTTGRLTSEMIIKSAQMGVAIVVSRSGITQMALAIASQIGLCAIGRAIHQRFLVYTARQRFSADAAAQGLASV